MKSDLLLVVALGMACAAPALAAGTVSRNHLVAIPTAIGNAGDAPIRCQAEIAHWFATDLATIAPGERADLGLWFDTATGTWAAMNTRGEALPIERAWCGLKGRTFETRWSLPLRRDNPTAQALDCTARDDRLDCR